MELTASQQEIKDEFIQARGTWNDTWESMLKLSPEFLRQYGRFSSVALRKRHLEPKIQEFIFIAIDANATHMFGPGIRPHVRKALEYGATPRELMEVMELISTLGIHAMNIGIPVLAEVLEEEGLRTGPAELNDHQQRLKAEFTANRGYWHSFWDEILELDPEMFEAYTDFSSVSWRTGVLEPKVKEMIYIAFDVAATHLYVPGLKLHIRNALGYGATKEEIIEVMEIASTLGIHGAMLGAPIIAEEIEAFAQQGTSL
jgi:alkylhydroperoxidase/carboxymuconolactone decarboxylase family protein YurZ